jgi:hypothetical protein
LTTDAVHARALARGAPGASRDSRLGETMARIVSRVSFNGHPFRVEHFGSITRVTVPAVYVDSFFRGFKGVTLPPARSYWFEFEWQSRDLVDHNVPSQFDSYVIAELANEAQKAV